MNFSYALEQLKTAKKVARQNWNGKGMFLYLVQGSVFTVNREPLLGILGKEVPVCYQAHIDMMTSQGSCVPWTASQTDLLAEDWYLVE
jgi:Protein of unknown function (DUF2829)